MKKYGDVVTYVRNGVELEALVVQSNAGAAGEELVMIYLDPALSSVVIRDMSKVAAKTFAVPPWTEGATQGWRDKPSTEPNAELQEQLAGANDQIKSLDEQLSKSNDQIKSLEGDVAEFDHQLAKAKDQIQVHQDESAKKDETIAQLVIAAQAPRNPENENSAQVSEEKSEPETKQYEEGRGTWPEGMPREAHGIVEEAIPEAPKTTEENPV